MRQFRSLGLLGDTARGGNARTGTMAEWLGGHFTATAEGVLCSPGLVL